MIHLFIGMATPKRVKHSEGEQEILLNNVERRLQVFRLCLLQRVFIAAGSACGLQSNDRRPVSDWGGNDTYRMPECTSKAVGSASKVAGSRCREGCKGQRLEGQNVSVRVSNLYNCRNPLCRALVGVDTKELHPLYRRISSRVTELLHQQGNAVEGVAREFEKQPIHGHMGKSYAQGSVSSSIENDAFDSDIDDVLSGMFSPSRAEVLQRLRRLDKRDQSLLFYTVRSVLIEKEVFHNADQRLAHYWLSVFSRDAFLMMPDKERRNIDSWTEACKQKLNKVKPSVYIDSSVHEETVAPTRIPLSLVPGVCRAAKAAPSFPGGDRAQQQLHGFSHARGLLSQSVQFLPVDTVFKATAVPGADGDVVVTLQQLLQHIRRLLRGRSPSAAAILSPALLLCIIRYEATNAAEKRLLQRRCSCSSGGVRGREKMLVSSLHSGITTCMTEDLLKALLRIKKATALWGDCWEISSALPSPRNRISCRAHLKKSASGLSNCGEGDGSSDSSSGQDAAAASEAARWMRRAFFVTDDVFLA